MSLRMHGPGGVMVPLQFGAVSVEAREGETVAAALIAAGVWRRCFCLMGVCQECLVEIDGEVVEACRARVRSGTKVVPL